MHPIVKLLLNQPAKSFGLPPEMYRSDANPGEVANVQQLFSHFGKDRFFLINAFAYEMLERSFDVAPDKYDRGMVQLIALIADNRDMLTDEAMTQISKMPALSKQMVLVTMVNFLNAWEPNAPVGLVKATSERYRKVVFDTIGDMFIAFDDTLSEMKEFVSKANSAGAKHRQDHSSAEVLDPALLCDQLFSKLTPAQKRVLAASPDVIQMFLLG